MAEPYSYEYDPHFDAWVVFEEDIPVSEHPTEREASRQVEQSNSQAALQRGGS